MRIARRAKSLLLSLLLPIVGTALLVLFTIGAVMLSANDRAIVWAEGTPAQMEEMQRRVSANPWFKHGRGREASGSNPRPSGCAAGAREYSFGSLGEFEAQAAREILELIATQAGARACLTNVFIINELPDRASQGWTQALASTILGASLLPVAMVVFVFVALSRRLELPALWESGPGGSDSLAAALSGGIGAGAGLSLAMMLAQSLDASNDGQAQAAASMTLGNVGYPLAFTLMVAVPVIEELAFRGWMIPLAERGIGAWPAALASSLLYCAASLPSDAWSAAGYLLLGVAYAGLYLRTRSVPACIVANVMVSATAFWLA